MQEPFARLLDELSGLLGCAPIDAPGDGPNAVRLAMEDVDFIIGHGQAPAGLLAIYCTFGVVEADATAPSLARILEINLALAAACAGALGMDGETRELMYIFHVPIVGLSASELLQTLRHAASQAHAWRRGDFTNRTATDIAGPFPDTAFA